MLLTPRAQVVEQTELDDYCRTSQCSPRSQWVNGQIAVIISPGIAIQSCGMLELSRTCSICCVWGSDSLAWHSTLASRPKIVWSHITGRTRFQGFSTTSHIGSQNAFYQTTLVVIGRLPIRRLGNGETVQANGCHGFDLDFNRHKKSDQKIRYSYWHANENRQS